MSERIFNAPQPFQYRRIRGRGQRRPSRPPAPIGVRILNVLLLTALAAIVVIEAAFIARIVMQASAVAVTSDLDRAIFDATDYLMQPFQEAGVASEPLRTTGIVEYDAVMAAEIYLIVGLGIAALMFIVNLLQGLRIRRRRKPLPADDWTQRSRTA